MIFSIRLTAKKRAIAESYTKRHSISLGKAFKQALFDRIIDNPQLYLFPPREFLFLKGS